ILLVSVFEMVMASTVPNSRVLIRHITMFRQCLILLNLLFCVPTYSEDDFTSRSPCYDQFNRAQRCVPEFVNAAFNIEVEVTNTCGNPPTEYCLQTGVTGPKKSCEICDSRIPQFGHPPSYLTDFNNNDNQTWWQSQTMYEGIGSLDNEVNLTLRLGKSFDITYVRLKFHSSRPESFAIFKKTSEDGKWIPYQYYSATCRDTYNISDSTLVSRDDQTKSLCTSEFSDISPLTGGNVAFSTLEGRPSAYNFENSPILQEWVTATEIQISLKRMNTFRDEIFGDPKVLRSYYYAISDFAVGGRCRCNGHASECVKSTGVGGEMKLVCRCQHKSMGADCKECLPFYNDKPWHAATSKDAHECQACNCNGRSRKCYFDEELYKKTGHGGHCLDCQGNTDGPNCERCKENHFQRSDGICLPCLCNKIGSRSLQCDTQGKCQCKPGVEGNQCDRCKDNFYEFSNQGCRECGCNVAGSVGNAPSCNELTGICQCKRYVEGQRCDSCKPGFFNLDESNEFGCISCFCYGHSSICSSATGYSVYNITSSFERDSDKWRVVDGSGNDVEFQYNNLLQNIGITSSPISPIYFSAPERYLKDQRASYNQDLSFTFRIGEGGPRATVEDLVLEGAGLSVSQPVFGQGNPMPTYINQNYVFKLNEDSKYGWNPRLSARDFISILTNLTAVKIKSTYAPQGAGFLDNVNLGSAQHAGVSDEAKWLEMCTCPEGYIGQFCESCAPGFRHDPPNGGPFARCIPCNCHGHADVCDIETGRCICKHNTGGDNCEICARGYYGNALVGDTGDCKECPCPNRGPCVVLPSELIACLECPSGYAGHRCNLCTDGYFGDPRGNYGPKTDCEKCNCNENVDTNAVGNCNRTTSECLKCIYNTGGASCEICLPGFFGDALAVPKGDCKACNCHKPGTKPDARSNLICDSITGQCSCKPNVRGKQCNRCEEGFWNLASGDGCQSCNCDLVGSMNHTCNVETGQCFCKEGITGQNCDQCMPYHYGFSEKGCFACDCDYTGSMNLQCQPDGQCNCRPNVEGRRCDRCKENKYGKESGCIDCPACYNLVQDAVNEHRAKLSELSELLDNINKNPSIIDDKDFEAKLKEVMIRVDELLSDAQRAAGSDGNLVQALKDLKERIADVQKTAEMITERIDTAEVDSNKGVQNITLAEDAIKRAQESLANARRYLETNGLDALMKARERSEKFGQQSDRMSEIAREARHLADQQEGGAKEIGNVANEALNTSSEAYRLARVAIDQQAKTADEINDLRRDYLGVAELMERTKKLADNAKKEALKAYNDALDIYTKAKNLDVPDIDVNNMNTKSDNIKDEAERIKKEAEDLMRQNQNTLRRIDGQKKEANELLARGIAQQQVTDALLADVDAAYANATDAVKQAEKILGQAKETLATLKGFDELVQQSKGEADKELKKVP
ncbi:LAMC3 (predicted), partial [Pycnogonum litorale]